MLERTTLFEEEKSNPSELCAAAFFPDAELGESPAVLFRVRPVISKVSQPVTSKQCTGQLMMLRLEITPFVTSFTTKKWSGL